MGSEDLQCSCNQAQPNGNALWLLNVNRRKRSGLPVLPAFSGQPRGAPWAGPHFLPPAARTRRACVRRTVCAHHHRATTPSQRRAEVHELPQPDSDDFKPLRCSNSNAWAAFAPSSTPSQATHHCCQPILNVVLVQNLVIPGDSATQPDHGRAGQGGRRLDTFMAASSLHDSRLGCHHAGSSQKIPAR